MCIAAVYRAYSNHDDAALAEALGSLQRKLISDVQALGPAAVSLRLREQRNRPLTDILNKTEVETSSSLAGRVAFLAGYLSAYRGYLALMVDRDSVDAADARLSADRDAHERVVRMMVLKTTFAYSGTRAKDLVDAVARVANVPESSVKFHLAGLVKLKLIERLKLGPKAVSYRISRLGEAVLARRSKPHELALFLVDQAAHDAALREAMKGEIDRTWPRDVREKDVGYEPVLPFPLIPRAFDPFASARVLNRAAVPYQEARRP